MAFPPQLVSISVLSTLFEILEVNVGVAVLLTVRSAPTQTFTVWLELPVTVWLSVAVNVAVFGWVVQVPAGSVNVFEYVNVVGLGSVEFTVPREPPNVSVTVMLPSTTVGVALPKSKPAVPVTGFPFAVAVAVLVPAAELGAAV